MAPARSIQCIKRPPSRAASGLASLGKTISAISDCECRTGGGESRSLLTILFLHFASLFRDTETSHAWPITLRCPLLVATSSLPSGTPYSIPPSSAPARRRDAAPIWIRRRRTPAGHLPRADGRVRIHTAAGRCDLINGVCRRDHCPYRRC